jgi:predicted enzyme related to lactoylglutathione lyase
MDAVVATVMTFSIGVISLPVSDVDRAVRFYVDHVGFRLDMDHAPNDTFRLVRLTPPGSTCSIQLGAGLGDALTGAFRTSILLVSDLEAARNRLLSTKCRWMVGLDASPRGWMQRAGTTRASPISSIRTETGGFYRSGGTAIHCDGAGCYVEIRPSGPTTNYPAGC